MTCRAPLAYDAAMRLFTSLIAGCIALLASGSLSAQKATDSAAWRFTIAPYFWYAGLTGDVGVRNIKTHVDQSPRDIVDKLKFGVLTYVEARTRSYVFGLDGMYMNLGHSQAVAIRGDTGSFALDLKQTMLQPSVGYTFGDTVSGFDILAGMRYWHLNTTLAASGPRGNSVARTIARSWVDALAGARYHYTFIPHYSVLAGGDVGGGGSHSTWQAYGFANAEALYWLTFSLGYRAIGVNYDHNELLDDTTMKGFLIAASFKF